MQEAGEQLVNAAGKELHDGEQLNYYSIEPDSTLHIISRGNFTWKQPEVSPARLV